MQSLIYARLLSQVWKLNVIAAFCFYSTGIASGDSNVTLSPLQKAIERGLRPAGKLGDEVYALKDYKVNSKDDAKAICMALASLSDSALKETGYGSPLYVLTGLFQDVDGADCPAFPILRDEGIKQLIKVYDSLAQNPTDDEADDLLMVLKMLALYGTHEGAERIVAAAQKSLKSDDYMWSVVLSILQEEHPEREFVFSSLAKQLPEGFIGIALLDAANQAAIKEDFKPHPFNSDQGVAKLRNWITSKNPEEYSYCHSAVVALPFINHADRDTLLGLAREHDDAGVRMEAAWASAKIGQKIGLDMLVEFSRDSIHSATAVQYLEELGRKDSVPMEAREPDFQAKAEFSNWLAHPNDWVSRPTSLRSSIIESSSGQLLKKKSPCG